ncbi:MAG: hypothetical protein P1T08_15670 [Acidimicrobiia bacterium]|nr:hypothetical protein [Acidimicrobiia bacterium]
MSALPQSVLLGESDRPILLVAVVSDDPRVAASDAEVSVSFAPMHDPSMPVSPTIEELPGNLSVLRDLAGARVSHRSVHTPHPDWDPGGTRLIVTASFPEGSTLAASGPSAQVGLLVFDVAQVLSGAYYRSGPDAPLRLDLEAAEPDLAIAMSDYECRESDFALDEAQVLIGERVAASYFMIEGSEPTVTESRSAAEVGQLLMAGPECSFKLEQKRYAVRLQIETAVAASWVEEHNGRLVGAGPIVVAVGGDSLSDVDVRPLPVSLIADYEPYTEDGSLAVGARVVSADPPLASTVTLKWESTGGFSLPPRFELLDQGEENAARWRLQIGTLLFGVGVSIAASAAFWGGSERRSRR